MLASVPTEEVMLNYIGGGGGQPKRARDTIGDEVKMATHDTTITYIYMYISNDERRSGVSKAGSFLYTKKCALLRKTKKPSGMNEKLSKNEKMKQLYSILYINFNFKKCTVKQVKE